MPNFTRHGKGFVHIASRRIRKPTQPPGESSPTQTAYRWIVSGRLHSRATNQLAQRQPLLDVTLSLRQVPQRERSTPTRVFSFQHKRRLAVLPGEVQNLRFPFLSRPQFAADKSDSEQPQD